MPRRFRIEEKKTVRTPEVLISVAEFNKRKVAWNEYYGRVRNTRAYHRFVEQRNAYKSGDKQTFNRLYEEAKQARIDGISELAKPPFPDPDVERVYGRLGIGEPDIVSVAREIFSEKEAHEEN